MGIFIGFTELFKLLHNFFNCYIMKNHNWTCNAMEDIPATKEELESGMDGFKSYAKMYCKNCKKVSKLSL